MRLFDMEPHGVDLQSIGDDDSDSILEPRHCGRRLGVARSSTFHVYGVTKPSVDRSRRQARIARL